MKTTIAKLMGLFVVFAFVFASSSFADENEVVGLKNKIDDLNKKISRLEKRLDSVAAEASKPTPAYVSGGASSAEGGLLRAAQDINMGGYVDVQYNYNTRQPSTGGATTGGTNALRIFDTDDNSFTVNAAELYFEKAAQEVGEAGFRVDLQFGEDSQVVLGDGTGGDKVDLQQAYVEYIAPLSFFEGNSILPDKINIKVGRFVTLAGLEVIEAPDNWNISRSLAFGFSLPFTHTGVRTNFGLFDDYFDAYVGVNNGWDTPVDTNGDKTLELAFGYEPLENVSIFHAWYLGNENADGSGAGNRFLWTNVVTWDATDKLSLMADFDWGRENNISANNTTANWYEFALYARYQFTEKFAMAYRSEIFVDDTIFRTGVSDRTWAQTFTAEYMLNDNLIARGEFRHDNSDDDPIIGVSNSSQATLAAQLIYVI